MQTSRNGPKRLRASPSEPQKAPSPCYFLRLPVELLTAIAKWTAHPRDILSLAYTCKHIYQLFAHKDSEFIWRYARNHIMLITRVATENGRAVTPKDNTLDNYVGAHWENLPIPPPLSRQTEISLAHLLFGQKLCPWCKKEHRDALPGAQMLLGINLCEGCRKTKTENAVITSLEAEKVFRDDEHQFPVAHFGTLINSLHKVAVRVDYFPASSAQVEFLSREAWTSIFRIYKKLYLGKSTSELDSFLKTCLDRAQYWQRPIMHPMGGDLDTWISRHMDHLSFLSKGFNNSAKAFIELQDIRFDALQRVPRFKLLQKESSIRPLFDFCVAAGPHLDQILMEARSIHDKLISQDLKKAEENQVKAMRHYLDKHPWPKEILPTLETFASFSAIKVLRNLHSTDVIAYEPPDMLRQFDTDAKNTILDFDTLLYNPNYKRLVDSEMNTWRKQAIAGARTLLGYSEGNKSHGNNATNKAKRKREKGKIVTEGSMDIDTDLKQSVRDPNASHPNSEDIGQTNFWFRTPGKLDPEFRVTAWFVCNVCHSLEPGHRRRGVFDFISMCAHQCQRPDCSKKDPLPWAIANFSQAPHAVETTRTMLKILGLDEEDPSTTTRCFDGLWLCKNCPETMKAMEWEDLIRHCSRHSVQRLEKITMGDAMEHEQKRAEAKRRLTVSQLLSNRKEGEKKRLLCVHCMPNSEVLSRAKLQVPGQTGQIGAPRPMDIHGIRQHLKVKHKIDDMRNEDIYFMDETRHNPTTVMFSETDNGRPTSDTSNSVIDSPHIPNTRAGGYGYRCWECHHYAHQYSARGLASHFRAVHIKVPFSFKHPEFRRQEAAMAAARGHRCWGTSEP